MSLLQWFWNLFHPHPAPAPAPPPVPPPPPPPPPPAGDPGPALLAAVNRLRQARGLAPVDLDAGLSAGASAYARQLAALRTEDHFAAGTTPGGRIAAALAPRRAGATGECVAVGQPSAEAVVAAWASRPPHRAILLGPYALAGFGLATGGELLSIAGRPAPPGIPGRYWVADFAGVM